MTHLPTSAKWTEHFLKHRNGRKWLKQNNFILSLSETLTMTTWRVWPTIVISHQYRQEMMHLKSTVRCAGKNDVTKWAPLWPFPTNIGKKSRGKWIAFPTNLDRYWKKLFDLKIRRKWPVENFSVGKTQFLVVICTLYKYMWLDACMQFIGPKWYSFSRENKTDALERGEKRL